MDLSIVRCANKYDQRGPPCRNDDTRNVGFTYFDRGLCGVCRFLSRCIFRRIGCIYKQKGGWDLRWVYSGFGGLLQPCDQKNIQPFLSRKI